MPIASITGVVKYERIIKSIPYDCGIYDVGNMTFECTEHLSPYVRCNGEYYVMNKIGVWNGYAGGPTPQTDYADYHGKGMWLWMEKAQIAIYESLLADFLNAGSAIFNGIYCYSHYGKDANGNETDKYQLFNPDNLGKENCAFTPNVLVNWLKGSMSALSGNIGAFRITKRGLEYIDTDSISGSGGTYYKKFVASFLMNSTVNKKSVSIDIDAYSKPVVSIDAPESKQVWDKDEVALKVTGNAKFVNDVEIGGTLSKPHAKGLSLNVREITSTTDLKADDDVIVCRNTTPITITLPSDAPIGKVIVMKQMTGNPVTYHGGIYPGKGNTIDRNYTQKDYAVTFELFKISGGWIQLIGW